MGDYTKLAFNAMLKSDMKTDVVAFLEACSVGIDNFNSLPDHDFFKTERWDRVLNQCYFEHNKEGFRLSIDSKFKNYGDEVRKFCDWIGPFLTSGQADTIIGSTEFLEYGENDAENSFDYIILRNCSIMFRSRRIATVAYCIGCGCHDRHACENGCWWLRVDYSIGTGVCSQCGDQVLRWDAGDHGKQTGALEKMASEDTYIADVERELGRKLSPNEQEQDIWELYDELVSPAVAAATLASRTR